MAGSAGRKVVFRISAAWRLAAKGSGGAEFIMVEFQVIVYDYGSCSRLGYGWSSVNHPFSRLRVELLLACNEYRHFAHIQRECIISS